MREYYGVIFLACYWTVPFTWLIIWSIRARWWATRFRKDRPRLREDELMSEVIAYGLATIMGPFMFIVIDFVKDMKDPLK